MLLRDFIDTYQLPLIEIDILKRFEYPLTTMKKQLLLTPGPTWIPERIFHAMHVPHMHHRTPEFEGSFKKALQNLTELTDAQETPILLSASGTGAMEAALRNCFAPHETIIVVNGGVFGERWVKIARAIDLTVVEIKVEPGTSPTLDQILSTVKAHPAAKGLAIQVTETSTTVNHQIKEVGHLLAQHAPEMLYVVDAVSALCTLPLSITHDSIDVLVAGSQKALMLPPGLALLMMSTKAWDAIRKKKSSRSFYFDLLAERKAHEQGTSAWTPAMNIILGLNEAFTMMKEEGFDAMYARHAQLSLVTRAGLKALGFKLITETHPSPAVTGAFPPEGFDAETIRSDILEDSGVRIAGGQDFYKGKVIRIGHMGYVQVSDMLTALHALERALVKRGAPRSLLGVGAQAALLAAKE
jgi:aspartate aminotransferase-like enzyme